MKKLLFAFLTTALALGNPISGACSGPLQLQSASIQKRYVNGDQVTLSCPTPQNTQCMLTVVLNKRTRNIPIDFQAEGLEPNLDSIALYVSSSDHWGFAIETGVGCRPEDEEKLDEQSAESAYCTVGFNYNNGKLLWSSVHVEPVSDVNIYTDIRPPASAP